MFVASFAMGVAGSAQAEVSLQLWTQQGEGDGGFAFVEKMVDSFMENNPDVKITVVSKDNEVLREDYQTASLAGDAPELLWTLSDHAGPFTRAGLIQPVDELIDLSVFVESAVQGTQIDGKTWGIPLTNGNHLMLLYNKDLLKDAPKTTDEMIEVAKGLTSEDTYGLVWNQIEPFWLVPWLGGFGGKVFAEDVITPTLNTKAMIDTLQFLYDLKAVHKIMPDECDYGGADTLFKEGKAAMIVNGDWSLADYKKTLGEDKLGAAALPMVSATGLWPAPYTSGFYLMISAGVDDEELNAILDFAEFVTNLDNQIDQIETLSRIPALKEALASETIQNDPVLKGSADQMTKGTPMPAVMEMRCNWDSMKPEQNAVMAGKKSPEDAAVAMQKAAESCIKTLE
jgi:arabinogalactan oligomer/maltooligosaccharide transport system substrate-binding protein